jgi:uncharacterized protein
LIIPVRDTADGATFLVRVLPRAGRSACAGIFGEGRDAAVKIALQAPPVEGRANAALIDFLSDRLGIPRSAIEITAGWHARTKTILVRGHRATELAEAIQEMLTAKPG